MAIRAELLSDHTSVAPGPIALGFERVIYSTVEEQSDSVPALKAATLLVLVGGSAAFWVAIAAFAWSRLA